MTAPLRFALIGSGRLASAVLSTLARRSPPELRLGLVAARRPGRVVEWAARMGLEVRALEQLGPADTQGIELAYLAVADPALPQLAARLDAAFAPDCVFAHGSGALGPDALGRRTRPCAQLHPLRSLQAGQGLEGTSFVAQGPESSRHVLARCVAALGGTLRWCPGLDASLYHAAASLLANGACALLADAQRLFVLASGNGIPQQDLVALLESVLGGLATRPVAEVLTGPVRRGEADTIAAHLRAITARAPELVPIYAELQRRVVALARATDASGLDAIEEVLRRSGEAQ